MNKPKTPENVIYIYSSDGWCVYCGSEYRAVDRSMENADCPRHDGVPYIPQSKYLELEDDRDKAVMAYQLSKLMNEQMEEKLKLAQEALKLAYSNILHCIEKEKVPAEYIVAEIKEALSKLQTKEGE